MAIPSHGVMNWAAASRMAAPLAAAPILWAVFNLVIPIKKTALKAVVCAKKSDVRPNLVGSRLAIDSPSVGDLAVRSGRLRARGLEEPEGSAGNRIRSRLVIWRDW